MTGETASRGRDREATRRAILQAAEEVLAEGGFAEFGVNAVARRAGCDKQLIYRYFNGLEGLVEAVGERLAEQLEAGLNDEGAEERPATYAALITELALGLLRLLRTNRLMLQITAWETVGPPELVSRLIAARSRRVLEWMLAMRGALAPPPGVDAGAVNALLIAGVQQLAATALRTPAGPAQFAALPLSSEEDWARIEAALRLMVARIYGEA